MTPTMSIIIPSQGRIDYLNVLFESFKKQDYQLNTEILLCASNLPTDLLETLPKLPQHFDVKVLPASATSISEARNLGLKNARGDFYFFMDEDCYLPSEKYLSELTNTLLKKQNYCGGGFYMTPKHQNYVSHGYNYICNFWLQRHITEENRSTLLLGGCSFYPAQIVKKAQAVFPEDCPRSGEEYFFNQKIQTVAPYLQLEQEWNIFHSPTLNFFKFCKKAWTQGKTLSQAIQHKHPKNTYQAIRHCPKSFIIYLPLMVIFFVLGRSAFLYSQLR